jgi:hypothetical protein
VGERRGCCRGWGVRCGCRCPRWSRGCARASCLIYTPVSWSFSLSLSLPPPLFLSLPLPHSVARSLCMSPANSSGQVARCPAQGAGPDPPPPHSLSRSLALSLSRSLPPSRARSLSLAHSVCLIHSHTNTHTHTHTHTHTNTYTHTQTHTHTLKHTIHTQVLHNILLRVWQMEHAANASRDAATPLPTHCARSF